MISYQHITPQAKRALSLIGIGVDDETIHTSDDTECIIKEEVFLYRCSVYINYRNRYLLLIESHNTLDVPLDFNEMDRYLSLFN